MPLPVVVLVYKIIIIIFGLGSVLVNMSGEIVQFKGVSDADFLLLKTAIMVVHISSILKHLSELSVILCPTSIQGVDIVIAPSI